MRIAIDGRMAKTKGGIGTYTRELLYQLAEMDSKNQYFVIVNKSGNLKISFSANNFSIVESSVSRKQYFIKDIWHQFFLPFFLKANHIDIYFNPRYILPYCSGSKMIVTIHDMIAFLYPEIWPGISGFRIRQYIRISSKRADKILTVSNCAKNNIMRILNIPEEKIKIIPCGINEKLYNPNHDKSLQNVIIKKYGIQKKYILSVGPLGTRKNHNRLIDAYSVIPKRIRQDYQLIITGERKGTYNNLLKKTGKTSLSDDIVFTGFIPEEEMPIMISAASLFVFPSLYEGFGIPLLEAMACGTPILASNVSSIPEVVGGAALLFDPYNINEMANAINRGLTDEDLRQELIQKGFERIKKYSWKYSAKEILGVFEEICNVEKR